MLRGLPAILNKEISCWWAPYTDQEMAGIMLSGLENREALEAVLKEDVYYADGMADYEVHAFKAGKIARDFASYEGK